MSNPLFDEWEKAHASNPLFDAWDEEHGSSKAESKRSPLSRLADPSVADNAPKTKPLLTIETTAKAPSPFEQLVARGMMASTGTLPQAQAAEEAMRARMNAPSKGPTAKEAASLVNSLLNPVELWKQATEAGKNTAYSLNRGNLLEAAKEASMYLIPAGLERKEMMQAARGIPSAIRTGKNIATTGASRIRGLMKGTAESVDEASVAASDVGGAADGATAPPADKVDWRTLRRGFVPAEMDVVPGEQFGGIPLVETDPLRFAEESFGNYLPLRERPLVKRALEAAQKRAATSSATNAASVSGASQAANTAHDSEVIAALDRIAQEAKGGADYEAAQKEIESVLSALRNEPTLPAMSDEARAAYEAHLANIPPDVALESSSADGATNVSKKRGRPRKTPAPQPALDIPESQGLQNRPGSISPRLVSALGGAAAGGIAGSLTGNEGDTQSSIARGALGALVGGAGGAMLGKMLPEAGAATNAAKVAEEVYAPRVMPLAEDLNPAKYTNAARFSENPRVQERLLAAAEEMARTKEVPTRTASGRMREPETLDSVRKRVADDMGIDIKDVTSRTKSGERIGRDDMLRVKTALDMAMDQETSLALKIKNREFVTEGMTDAAIAEEERLLRTDLARTEADRRALMEVLSSQRTSTARDLNALKAASLRNFDPAAWEIQLERYAQRPLTQQESIAARVAAANKDADKLMQLANKVKKSTLMEKVGTYFQANLLTAPSTQLANIGGNVAEAALETAKDAPATLIDHLLSIKTGIRTKDFDPINSIKASFQGAKSGLQEYGAVMRGEVLPGKTLADMPREVNFETPILNMYTKGVLRSLSATDNVFRKTALFRSIEEQARVIAKAENKAGKLSSEAFNSRISQLRLNPTIEMEANAIAAADFATFQKDSRLARIAGGIAKSGGGAGKILFPFTRTPANIVMQAGYHYTPLALAGELKNLTKLLLSEAPKTVAERHAMVNLQRNIAENIGRASIGTAALGLGYWLAKDGRMTGFFPQDQRTRDEWEQQGKLEGAAKVGNTWVQVNRLSPLGNLMQIGAAMYDVRKNPGSTLLEQSKSLGASATAPLRTVSELPMVSNLKDLIEVGTKFGTEESVDALAKIGARTATGFAPASSMIRTISRVVDPTVRETKGAGGLETTANEIQAQIPFFSKGLPEKVDPLGTVVRREGGPLAAFLSPITARTSLPDVNPLRGEMARVGAVAGRIKREVGETGQQFADREKMTGSSMARVMSAVTNSPGYKQISTMPTASLRQLLDQAGENTANLTDEKIRSKVQGFLLENVMNRVKTRISEERAKTKPTPSAAKSLIKSIVR